MPLRPPSTDSTKALPRTSSTPWASWAMVLGLIVVGCCGFGLTTQSLFPTAILAHAPPLCDPHVRQSSGYLDVAPDTSYFYWYFEARHNHATAPLVLWLNGGPVASSLAGLLLENGPCRLDLATLRLATNPHSWTEVANVIWLDQPANVGFSEGPSTAPADIGPNVVVFLIQFLLRHPELRGRPLYIAGESYAGHYVPAIAAAILEAKHNQQMMPSSAFLATLSPVLNLRGILIGNGLTNTKVQAQHELDMVFSNAYNIPLIPTDQLDLVKDLRSESVKLLDLCLIDATVCSNATLAFVALQAQVSAYGNRNPFDIRQDCIGQACLMGLDSVTTFLNDPSVQASLGVHQRSKPYQATNPDVFVHFLADVATNYGPFVESILAANVPVLLYAGDADLRCNWRGVDAWPKELKWAGAHGYLAAPLAPYVVNGVEVGQIRTHSLLTFVRVFHAGHMVPRDQPAVALELLTTFLSQRARLT
ncbi:Aste57867_9588 [Aphanomyces stellatus]|uniref:Carboxypeptidase n=1 Tax=Aphanomyces stellatus TaxID=120398 RepID=A0A485KNJ5_9STRA|nr:hypothetical protein As57867_009550 [Aphanomyces stellatus]VFT86467.1 Aste57867_9588 [Aphanomyces stellatus]